MYLYKGVAEMSAVVKMTLQVSVSSHKDDAGRETFIAALNINPSQT